MTSKMNKYILIPMLFLFFLSITLNIYFINTDSPKIDTASVKSQTQYIEALETELNTVKETLGTVSKNTNSKTLTSTSLKDITEIENTAIKFIEHIYNISPENYVEVKASAREFMSKKLAETLFDAPGIDQNNIDFVTEAVDIEVFQHTKDKQAIVRFNVYSKQISNNYEKEEQQIMCLYFKRLNGRLMVEAIEPISDLGEV